MGIATARHEIYSYASTSCDSFLGRLRNKTEVDNSLFMVFDRHAEQPPHRWIHTPSPRDIFMPSAMSSSRHSWVHHVCTLQRQRRMTCTARLRTLPRSPSRPLMLTVAEGLFIMGTARTSHEPFSFDLQYDDTEQPQRRVWLNQYEIDRDEVSLGEYLLWLRQQQRHLSRRSAETDRSCYDYTCHAARDIGTLAGTLRHLV